MVKLKNHKGNIKFNIRPYKNSDLNQILSLISRSDSTNRSEKSWSKNNMTGILGFIENKLIGAIPFEKRNLVLENENTSKVLWISAAHVDKDYRSLGLGSKLDKAAREFFYQDFQAIFVYRGDENSLAFKWYKKLGYYNLMPIISLKFDVYSKEHNLKYKCYSTQNEIKLIESELFNCYHKNYKYYGGSPYRHRLFWSEKIDSHYYQKNYSFFLIVLHNEEKIDSYAIIGETNYRDSVARFEILEYCCPNSDIHRNRLISSILNEANKRGLKEIRIQLSNQDPGLEWFEKFGFFYRWRTNVLGSIIKPEEYFKNQINKINNNKNFCITYETPSLGKNKLGRGFNKFGIFLSDREFIRLLLCRTNLTHAIEEGRILVTQHNDKILRIIEKTFFPKKWVFHQIDYI